MVNILKQLSDVFDKESANIVKSIRNNDGYSSDIFSGAFSFDSITSRPRQIRGKSGVYVFIISKAVAFNTEEVRKWNSIEGAGFKDYQEKTLNAGDCLYVGSGDSIFQRMTAHFGAEGESTGLKLGHDKRKKAEKCVRVYAFPLKEDFAEYSDMIIRQVEKRLHAELKPIAGSSRI